jgi:hypothetical protein
VSFVAITLCIASQREFIVVVVVVVVVVVYLFIYLFIDSVRKLLDKHSSCTVSRQIPNVTGDTLNTVLNVHTRIHHLTSEVTRE